MWFNVTKYLMWDYDLNILHNSNPHVNYISASSCLHKPHIKSIIIFRFLTFYYIGSSRQSRNSLSVCFSKSLTSNNLCCAFSINAFPTFLQIHLRFVHCFIRASSFFFSIYKPLSITTLKVLRGGKESNKLDLLNGCGLREKKATGIYSTHTTRLWSTSGVFKLGSPDDSIGGLQKISSQYKCFIKKCLSLLSCFTHTFQNIFLSL